MWSSVYKFFQQIDSGRESTMFRSKFIAGVLLLNSMFAGAAIGVGDGNTRPASSYPTELWRMEFRKQKERKEDSVFPSNAESGSGGGASAFNDDSVSLGGETAFDFGSETIPGQTELEDLQNDTPFAEWQVDEAASGYQQEFEEVPTSAWTLSKAGESSAIQPQLLSDGPSAITFLVAIVAVMVVVGATFSGRE